MLTESEREWLKKRKQWAVPHNGYGDEGYFCEHCKINCFDGCPTEIRDGNIDAFVDALKFSERVAVKLATDESCGVDEDCPPNMPYGWGRLKAARLQVEEEMDGTV